MKKQIIYLIVLTAIAFLGGFFIRGVVPSSGGMDHDSANAGNGANAEAVPDFYTCSMHPQIKQPKPGDCPLCGMDLVSVVGGLGQAMGPSQLEMSPRAQRLAEVETVPVERKFVTADIRMVGKVDYDETKRSYITAWVGGRLDRLFVDYTGVAVKQGYHLVELYSPELYQAQEELLSAVAASKGMRQSQNEYLRGRSVASVDSAREKLRLWGLEERQIQAIEAKGEPTDRVTINSPISGIVVHKNAVEGMYVQTGTQIYTVADLSTVWVKLDAYESDLAWLHYGQEVEFRTEAYPGDVFRGQIAFIDPILDAKTRTVKIRVNLPNPEGKLKPDMFVRAVVKSRVAGGGRVMDAGLAGKWISPMHPEIVKDEPGDCDICGMDLVSAESLGFVAADEGTAPLVIPSSAPLITGKRAVVYVDLGQGTFEGREVVLGPRAGDHYLVEAGLEEGELVVTKGNFKIDSAVQILAKPSMMNPGAGQLSSTSLPRGEAATLQEEVMASYSVPQSFQDQIGEVLNVYLQMKEALSHDRFDGGPASVQLFGKLIGEMDSAELDVKALEVWEQSRGQLLAGLEEYGTAGDIESGRKAFGKISEALIVTVRAFGVTRQAVHLYRCPMAFGGEGGDWLQGRQGTENPYYGSQMFRCGSLVETLGGRAGSSGTRGAPA